MVLSRFGMINTVHIPEELEAELYSGNAGNFWSGSLVIIGCLEVLIVMGQCNGTLSDQRAPLWERNSSDCAQGWRRSSRSGPCTS